jgi:hypothetical protein
MEMIENKYNNWFKTAMPKIDDEGTDGGIFGSPTGAPQQAPYSSNNADFAEIPFNWLQPIDGGALTKRMNFLLGSLASKHSYLPEAKIAHSINNGITMYLNTMCGDEGVHDAGFDCKSVLAASPSHDQLTNASFEPDELAQIVFDKLNSYFNYKKG